jgi:hypothetical protein
MMSGMGQAGVPLGHGAEQRDDIQMLVRCLVHPIVAGLGGERHKRRVVHIGIGDASEEICRARPERGKDRLLPGR